jgi:hypothetical protein
MCLDKQNKVAFGQGTISEHEVKHAHGSVVVAIGRTRYCDCNLTDCGPLNLDRLGVRQLRCDEIKDNRKATFFTSSIAKLSCFRREVLRMTTRILNI